MDENRKASSRELAVAIAAHLPGWSLEPPPEASGFEHGAVLARKDGAAIVLYVSTYGPPRLVVDGRYPRFADGRLYSGRMVRITCHPCRPAKALALDIARRLLPDYLRRYEEARQEVAQREREEAAALAFAQKLAAIVGAAPRPGRRGGAIVTAGDAVEGVYGHFDIDAGETPRISLALSGLSTSQAERIAEVLRSASDTASAKPETAREG